MKNKLLNETIIKKNNHNNLQHTLKVSFKNLDCTEERKPIWEPVSVVSKQLIGQCNQFKFKITNQMLRHKVPNEKSVW